MARKRTPARRPEAVPRRLGSKPSIYLPVQDPGKGWGRVEKPLTGRELLRALADEQVDLDQPVEVLLNVRHDGTEYLTAYTFHAHSAFIDPEGRRVCIDIGETDDGPTT